MSISDCKIIDLPKIEDYRGNLTFIEQSKHIPFEIKLPPPPMSVGLEIFKPDKPIGRVALFTGCAINYTRPTLGRVLIRTLFALGYEVILPAGEVCCGAPLRSLGMHEEAKQKALRNLEVFGKLKTEAILSLCPTCTLTIKKEYPNMTGQSLESAMDATEFLAPRLEGSAITAPEELRNLKIGYHAKAVNNHGFKIILLILYILQFSGR